MTTNFLPPAGKINRDFLIEDSTQKMKLVGKLLGKVKNFDVKQTLLVEMKTLRAKKKFYKSFNYQN